MFVTVSLIVSAVTILCRCFRLHNVKTSHPQLKKKVEIASDEGSAQQLARVLLRYLKESEHRVVGFDCEWVTKGKWRQPIALLQLSTNDGLCALFRLTKLKPISMPLELKALLEDPSVLKVGVCPLIDAAYLLKDQGVIVKGCVDLRHLSGSNAGLATLAKTYLDIELEKDINIRCSNWEDNVLDDRQIEYAALDALVSLRIFWALIGDEKLERCNQFCDVPYNIQEIKVKQGRGKPCSNLKPARLSTLKTVKKPLYEGVFIQTPDGSTLVTCNTQKANWYLKKDLAVKVCEDPLTIRLKFEPDMPSTEKTEDLMYYRQVKDNCCVVCGSTTSHLRKNIVPVEYRKHFPVEMKSHVSHDVLLMCTRCHSESIRHDRKLRLHLVEKCQAPFIETQLVLLPELVRLTSAAKTMLAPSGVPEEKMKEAHGIVANHLQCLDYDNGVLEDIARINPRVKDESCSPHGEKVVAYYQDEDGGLFTLQTLWRQHFLNTMCPQFLPKYWSVNHGQNTT